MANYNLFFDGSCGPKNPGGIAAYGFALFQEGNPEYIAKGSGIIGEGAGMTNNLAEFHALSEGLRAYLVMTKPETFDRLHVYGDSNLVVKVMSCHYRARQESAYYPAYLHAFEALKEVRKSNNLVTLDWIPREQNQFCDALSKAHSKKI